MLQQRHSMLARVCHGLVVSLQMMMLLLIGGVGVCKRLRQWKWERCVFKQFFGHECALIRLFGASLVDAVPSIDHRAVVDCCMHIECIACDIAHIKGERDVEDIENSNQGEKQYHLELRYVIELYFVLVDEPVNMSLTVPFL